MRSLLEMKKAVRPLFAWIAFDSPRPCLIKIHAIDARENIDRDRLPSKADEFSGIRKIVNGDVA